MAKTSKAKKLRSLKRQLKKVENTDIGKISNLKKRIETLQKTKL